MDTAEPMDDMLDVRDVVACPSCCTVHRSPARPGPCDRWICVRCGGELPRPELGRLHRREAACLALAALLLYPFAMGLPLLEMRRFGHLRTSSLVESIDRLFEAGHGGIAVLLALFSVVLPLAKILLVLRLSLGSAGRSARLRRWLLRALDWTGRLGMLDVLVAALMIVFLEIGEYVELRPHVGVFVLAAVVLLALAAGSRLRPWDVVPAHIGRRERA